jgi:hypothetical protein
MLIISYFHIFSKCNEILHIVCYLILWSGGILEKTVVSQLLEKFLTFYGAGRFITVYKNPLLAPVLSHMNPYYTFPFCSFKI